jgi:8-oxo-dGTP diphosphatase
MITLAGCVILDKNNRVLLIHRNTARLVQWELPGGKVEPGEQLSAAAIREAREEISVKVTIKRELGQANFDDNGETWEYHWFLAEVSEGTPRVGELDKFDGVGYFDLQQVDQSEVSINIRNLTTAIKSGQVTL